MASSNFDLNNGFLRKTRLFNFESFVIPLIMIWLGNRLKSMKGSEIGV